MHVPLPINWYFRRKLPFCTESYIKSAKFYLNIYDTSITIKVITAGSGDVEVIAYLDDEEVGHAKNFSCGNFKIKVMLTKKLLWEVGKGGLYDLEL